MIDLDNRVEMKCCRSFLGLFKTAADKLTLSRGTVAKNSRSVPTT